MDGRKCHNCDWYKEQYKNGGWCFMFKEQPTFTKCYQKVIDGKKVKSW